MKILLIMALLAATIQTALGYNIFGEDDRKIIHSTKMGSLLKQVVQISYGCTGAFVGERLILTAGHCVYDKNLKSLQKSAVYTKREGDYYSKKYTMEKIWVDDYIESGNSVDDWAIILIKEKRKGDYFEIEEPLYPLESISLAGYSADLNLRLGLHSDCSAYQVPQAPSFFYHDCDTTKGASGSPIYNSSNKIIGVHLGALQDGKAGEVVSNYDQNYANVGLSTVKFGDLIYNLREQYNLKDSK